MEAYADLGVRFNRALAAIALRIATRLWVRVAKPRDERVSVLVSRAGGAELEVALFVAGEVAAFLLD